jgi:uncharacterized protein YndB with AHSA1/START domain
VFHYLTDASLIVRWMGDWADLRPVEGGPFTVDINGVPIRGRYVAVEPPHRVVFTWGVAGNDGHPPGSSIVEITPRADGSQTVLELAHAHLPADELGQHGSAGGTSSTVSPFSPHVAIPDPTPGAPGRPTGRSRTETETGDGLRREPCRPHPGSDRSTTRRD